MMLVAVAQPQGFLPMQMNNGQPMLWATCGSQCQAMPVFPMQMQLVAVAPQQQQPDQQQAYQATYFQQQQEQQQGPQMPSGGRAWGQQAVAEQRAQFQQAQQWQPTAHQPGKLYAQQQQSRFQQARRQPQQLDLSAVHRTAEEETDSPLQLRLKNRSPESSKKQQRSRPRGFTTGSNTSTESGREHGVASSDSLETASSGGEEESAPSTPTPTSSGADEHSPKEGGAGETLALDLPSRAREYMDLVRSGDVTAVHAHYIQQSADDVQWTWPDLSIDIRGSGNLAAFLAKMRHGVPDLRLTVDHIEQLSSHSLKVQYTISGTQRERLIPLFAVGRPTSWQCEAQVTFNDFGKTVRNVIQFVLNTSNFDACHVEGLSNCALALSATPSGSRMLQAAIEAASGFDVEAIVGKLRGHVWEASGNPHANHVVQKFITASPAEHVQFIVHEMSGRAVSAAQHRIRCRVLERLIEHCPHHQTAHLVDELIQHGLTLARHPFGNFVAQHVFEHGSPDQRVRMAQAIVGDIGRLARHRIANNVVRAALTFCPPQGRQALVQALAGDPEELASLSHHCVGSFVVRELKRLNKYL